MPGQVTNQTLDQRRAKHAWEAVTSLGEDQGGGKRKYGPDAEDYAREAKRLPVRILSCGLGPALSFLLAKKKAGTLHDDLTAWVIKERNSPAEVPASLRDSIVQGNSDFLRRATDEALAYLQWINRFAEAEELRGED